jgi:hypothetical protein
MTNPPVFTEGIVRCIKDRNAPTVGIDISDAIVKLMGVTKFYQANEALRYPNQLQTSRMRVVGATLPRKP